MPKLGNKLKVAAALVMVPITLSLSGCSVFSEKRVEWEYIKPEQQPVLTAVGYAPISTQQGETDTIKMLKAMRASKLDAYRELAEQVYGHQLQGNQSVANLVLQDVDLKASVDGVIRGAEVIKSYPIGEDVYATELRLDFQTVYDLYLATARPKKVREGIISSLF